MVAVGMMITTADVIYYSPDQDGWRVYVPKFDCDPAIYASDD